MIHTVTYLDNTIEEPTQIIPYQYALSNHYDNLLNPSSQPTLSTHLFYLFTLQASGLGLTTSSKIGEGGSTSLPPAEGETETLLSSKEKGRRKKGAAAAKLGPGGVGVDEPLSSDSDDDEQGEGAGKGGEGEQMTGDVLGDEGSIGSGSQGEGGNMKRSPSRLRRLGHSFRSTNSNNDNDVTDLADVVDLVETQLPQNDEGSELGLGDPSPLGDSSHHHHQDEHPSPINNSSERSLPLDHDYYDSSSELLESRGGPRTALSSQQVRHLPTTN